MAARTRASLPDDDSLGEQIPFEMVRIDAPQTTATPTIQIDPDEPIALDESAGTLGSSGLAQTDFLNNTNTTLLEGASGEYEIPNLFTYKKVSWLLYESFRWRIRLFQIEKLLEQMQDENAGLPIKSVKSFMSKIPSVFTGGDLIQWVLKTLDVDDAGTYISLLPRTTSKQIISFS